MVLKRFEVLEGEIKSYFFIYIILHGESFGEKEIDLLYIKKIQQEKNL